MIMELLQPSIHELHTSAERNKELNEQHRILHRRLDEMEYTYQKVKKNADLQQDMLKKLEARQEAMTAFEKQLKEEMKEVTAVKGQINERFRLLRDDRNALLKKVDNIDYEVGQYRKDIVSYRKEVGNEYGKKINDLWQEDVKLGQQLELMKSTIHGVRLLVDQAITEEIKDIHLWTSDLRAMVERRTKIVDDLD